MRLCKTLALLFAMTSSTAPSTSAEADRVEFAIAVHGGAGAWASLTEDDRTATEAELRRVLILGRDMLAAGESSLDVVDRIVAELEDSPYFNAGRGATFNAKGEHELDASIMDGRNLACGAVAGVSAVKNPIKLARAVMERTKHVMLIGEGADAFAKSQQLELVDVEYFWTPRQRERLKKWRARYAVESSEALDDPEDVDDHHGTVGCVALDREGHLAAATSTGGLEGKLPGRIGDSPVIAAGTYANDAACAVSCTGVGEEFIRRAVAYDIAARMRYGKVALNEAVAAQFEERLRPNDGGLIAVDREGHILIRFNTPMMARGAADSTGRFEASLGP